MWESDDSGIFDEMERRLNSMVEETFQGIESSLFDADSRCLKPLFRIEVTDDEVIVTFDLPCVEKDDVSLVSTEDSLNIEARMRKPVSLRLGGSLQKNLEFEKYSKSVRLPVKVDPTKAKAKFGSGLLTIRFPILRKGTAVRIS